MRFFTRRVSLVQPAPFASLQTLEQQLQRAGLLEEAKPFLLWFRQQALPTEASRFITGAEALGFGFGTIAAYPSYVLSSGFGTLAGNFLNANPASTTFVEIFFGSMDLLPLSALLSPLSQQEFKKLAEKLSGRAALPERKDVQGLRYGIKGIETFLSLCGFTPFLGTSLAYTNLPVSLLSIVGSYLGLRVIQRAIYFKYLNLYIHEPEEVGDLRKRSITALVRSQRALSVMTQGEVDNLYQLLFSGEHAAVNDHETLACLKLLLEMQAVAALPPEVLSVSGSARDFFHYSVSAFLALGMLYSLYIFTFMISDYLAGWVGITDPAVLAGLDYLLTVLAFLPNIVFITYICKLTLDLLSQSLQAGQYRPSTERAIATLIAGGSSTAYVFLSISGFSGALQIFLALTSLLGPTVVRSSSFTNLLIRVPSNWDRLRGLNSPRLRRMKLGDTLNLLLQAVSVMDADLLLRVQAALRSLDYAEMDNQPSLAPQNEVSLPVLPLEDREMKSISTHEPSLASREESFDPSIKAAFPNSRRSSIVPEPNKLMPRKSSTQDYSGVLFHYNSESTFTPDLPGQTDLVSELPAQNL